MKQHLHESPGNPEQPSSSVVRVWRMMRNVGTKIGRVLVAMTEEPIPLHESPGNPEQPSSSVVRVWRMMRSVGTRIGKVLIAMTEEPIPYEIENLLTPETVEEVMGIYYSDRWQDYNTPTVYHTPFGDMHSSKDERINSIAGLSRGMDTILGILEMHFNICISDLPENQNRALRIFFAKKIGLMHGA